MLIYTAFIVLVNLMFWLSLFGKLTIDIPVWRFFKPQSRFNFYFAFVFQIFYWSSHFGIMNYFTI